MRGKGRIEKIVSGFSGLNILIIGDLILDEFLWGDVSRISPEAPVPVVWIKSESFMPGGAANVANNINALGGKPLLVGVVGDDDRGRMLKGSLNSRDIITDGVIVDGRRPTTLKTRVIAHHQQVVRIDKEKLDGLSKGVGGRIAEYVNATIGKVDAVIIEDYGKGVVTPDLLKYVIKLARKHNKIVAVDPKEEHLHYYKGVTVITPNHHEASAVTGIKVRDKKSLEDIGKALIKKLNCEAALITLGENGMQLFEKKGRITHIPTVAQDVFDVSGAGDTVISAFTMCLASGAGMIDAARISNAAAGIVVGKVGIAVAKQKEIISKMSSS